MSISITLALRARSLNSNIRAATAKTATLQLLPLLMRRKSRLMSTLRDLHHVGLSENTFVKYLDGEAVEVQSGDNIRPRQVKRVHYTPVLPESVPSPYFISASSSCAEMLELDPDEFAKVEFAKAFVGNTLLTGLDTPYATVYGCHCYGNWFGQLGDGRALSIGEIYTNGKHPEPRPIDDISRRGYSNSGTSSSIVSPDVEDEVKEEDPSRDYYGDHVFELQLKGCGRSPYSRGFDGRAVLRSSVREFLVSESMFHLGVPTTRALSIIGTGQEIRRPWYAATSTGNLYEQELQAARAEGKTNAALPGKFSPDTLLREPGVVLCRVARSFLRFGQMELFGLRGKEELPQLVALADYACFREFPHLLEVGVLPTKISYDSDDDNKRERAESVEATTTPTTTTTAATTAAATTSSDAPGLPDRLPAMGGPERYVELYRCVAYRTANLVAQWLRVGYVQGNMNSDNTLLGGRTIDYGPYGWLEKFDPYYQPFTSDTEGKFAFIRQPTAMQVNVQVLGESTFVPLVKHAYMYANEYAGYSGASEADAASAATASATASSKSLEAYLAEVRSIAETEFATFFLSAYNDVKRRKLGLVSFDHTREADAALWDDCEKLMYKSQCDFTIFYRLLGQVAESFGSSAAGSVTATATSAPAGVAPPVVEDALNVILAPAFYDEEKVMDDTEENEWLDWLKRYHERIIAETHSCNSSSSRDKIDISDKMTIEERRRMQDAANPKYVLRNWMATLAYEKAAGVSETSPAGDSNQSDYSVIEELMRVLAQPYAEQSPDTEAKWFRKTPTWAQKLPGVEFMS